MYSTLQACPAAAASSTATPGDLLGTGKAGRLGAGFTRSSGTLLTGSQGPALDGAVPRLPSGNMLFPPAVKGQGTRARPFCPRPHAGPAPGPSCRRPLGWLSPGTRPDLGRCCPPQPTSQCWSPCIVVLGGGVYKGGVSGRPLPRAPEGTRTEGQVLGQAAALQEGWFLPLPAGTSLSGLLPVYPTWPRPVCLCRAGFMGPVTEAQALAALKPGQRLTAGLASERRDPEGLLRLQIFLVERVHASVSACTPVNVGTCALCVLT